MTDTRPATRQTPPQPTQTLRSRPNKEPFDEALSIRQVAVILGMTTLTIYRRINSGDIHAYRLPGRRGPWRINASTIHELQNGRKSPVRPELDDYIGSVIGKS